METLHKLAFWVVRKWYGILLAHFAFFAATYLLIWQVIEPMGIPDVIDSLGCRSPLNTRIFWHLAGTFAVSPMLTTLFDALVKRKLWRTPELMLRVEQEIALRIGNTANNVFEAMRISGNFQVLEAYYWTRNARINVTDQLQDKIRHGKLTVLADNSLGGDPEAGVSKKLTIRYLEGELIKVRTIQENDSVSLP